MKFDIIVADAPWSFSDTLTMSSVKRGAQSNYNTMSLEELKSLSIQEICADDCVLALWVPSALLNEGIEVMEAWGFTLKQTWIWVKIKKQPLELLKDAISSFFVRSGEDKISSILNAITTFNLNEVLAFGMGRLFRQTHEVALIGTRGSPKPINKSQRSVFFDVVRKHSEKPEGLQDKLELMFPDSKKLEMFARRMRKNWICVGNECDFTRDQDVRSSLSKLSQITYEDLILEEILK